MTQGPPKDAEDHMLLATWNVRDFGKPEKQRKGFGRLLRLFALKRLWDLHGGR